MLVDPSTVGAELLWVDRGGDITYHGPGQLVGYPVFSVPSGPSATPCYIHEVEQLVIDALAERSGSRMSAGWTATPECGWAGRAPPPEDMCRRGSPQPAADDARLCSERQPLDWPCSATSSPAGSPARR